MVKITLGSNYAKHYLGVSHVQPHEYHYITTNVSIKVLAKICFDNIYPFMVMFDLIFLYLIFPYFTTLYNIHNSLVSQLLTVRNKMMKHWYTGYRTGHELVWEYQIKNLYSESDGNNIIL